MAKDAQEEWRRVSVSPDYIVSNLGRIRRSAVGAPILKGYLDKDGYRIVKIAGAHFRAHRIVCDAFHGPSPKGTECAHLDGNPGNNEAANLAWLTSSENNRQKKLHGTAQAGEAHPRAKLSVGEVAAIRSDARPTRELARIYGISQSHVVRIRKGQRW